MTNGAGRFGARAFLVAAVLGPLACGSPPPPAAPVAAPPPPPTAAKPAEPDLSPVDEPKSLLVVARWASPQQTLDAVKTMFKLPVDPATLLRESLPEKEEAALFQLDAPVDAVVALDPASRDMSPEVFAAFSLPLTSYDDAKNAAGKDAVETRPGVTLMKKKRHEMSCAIARSVGKAPARLVCGQRERDLDALLPWLTRGAPNATIGKSDMHFELRLKPAQEKYQGMLSGNAGQLGSLASMMLSRETGINDPAVLDTVSNLVGEGVAFVDDLDSLTVDGAFNAAGAIDWTSTAKYRHANSWLVKVATNKADQAGPPPAIFFQAPKDSDSVQYGRGADKALFAGITKGLAALANAGLSKTPLAEADRKAITATLEHMPLPSSNQVAAQGHLDVAAPKLKPGQAPKAADILNEQKAKIAATVGWTVVGIDEPSTAYVAWVKELAATWNRPGIQTALKKLVADNKPMAIPAPPPVPGGKVAPKVTVQKSDPTKLIPKLRVGTVPGLTGATLLEGTVDVDSNLLADGPVPEGAPAKGQVGVRIVVMPDGANRTWVGLATDIDPIKQHLLMVKDGAPKEGTIASRDGIDAVKTSSAIGGGFFTLNGLVVRQLRAGIIGNAFGRGRHARDEKAMQRAEEVLAKLPNKGSTPIVLLSEATGGATPSSTIELHVTKGTVDDVATLVNEFLPIRASAGEPPSSAATEVAPVPPPPPPPNGKPGKH